MKFKKTNITIKDSSVFNRIVILVFLLGIIICVGIHNTNKDILVTSTTNKHKIVYLTFDDGPSDIITNEILDVLKVNNIKATFFVVGHKIQGREEILKRMLKEEHSIGLHTYTHNYKKIYSSEKCFIDEMNKTRDEVKKITGSTSNIIRFPAGSKPHLNKSLLNKLHAENYKIYDWNAALSDGLNCNTSPSKLFEESTKVIGGSSTIILLMHCGELNENTCKALPKIIEFYKLHGYEFKNITDTTPEFYFRFK